MKQFSVLLAALLLAACVTPVPKLTLQQREQNWQEHSARLAAVRSWSLKGRVAAHADGRGWQAGIRWKKLPDEQEVTLTGPFGGGVILLTENPSGFILRDNRGDEYFNHDAEQLLQQVTGWRLPVNGLSYWVRGAAMPDTPVTVELDDEGRAKKLVQQGWYISYLKYESYNGLPLPGRMLLEHSSENSQSEKLEIRLVLNSWKISQ